MAETQSSSADWAHLPFKAASEVQPFSLNVPPEDIQDFQQLLKLTRLVPKTYENTLTDGRYGVSHEWMSKAIDVWKNAYDWTARQARINRHPQFKMDVQDDQGENYDIHFMALFSQYQNALPILMLHGWPGNFMEFHGVLDLVKAKYNAETCPYHLVVPSLPGYALSSGPRLTDDFTYVDAAALMDKLMVNLGFEAGYVVQGGDAGGIMAPVLANISPRVMAIHVNVVIQPKPDEFPEVDKDPDLSASDRFKIDRTLEFLKNGHAYSTLHSTRPATTGFVVGSNPISILAWVGEKMLQWVDPRTPLPLEKILDSVTLYWFTNSIPRNLWIYRNHSAADLWCLPTVKQPVGYSRFPYDVDMALRKWVDAMCNLQFFRDHDAGGHFAALEKPELLWPDVEEFCRKVSPASFDLRPGVYGGLAS